MENKVEYCRNCKRNIAASNYVIHSVHCERNIQLCNLCQEPVPRCEVEKHMQDYHSIDPCSSCGVEVEKCQLEKHKEVCTKRLVSCKFCNLDLPLDQLPEHIAACGSRTEKCLRCNTHVMIKDQEEHGSFCIKREIRVKRHVSCKFCDLELLVDQLHEHIVTCGSRTQKCLQCDTYVMIRNLEEHSTFCMQTGLKRVDCNFCGQRFPMNLFAEHLGICGTRTERCLVCNEHVMVQDRNTHLSMCGKDNSIKESISCDYCGGLFPYNHLNDHKVFCGARTEKCERCKKWVMLKDQGKHLSECGAGISSGLVPCEYCKKLILPDHYPEHAAICLHQLKCGKCDKYVQPEDREMHFTVCNEETVIKFTFPCEYCYESISDDLLEEHVKTCGSRTEKCVKCKNYVFLKDKEKHQMTCQTVSKTYGKCPVCNETIPWVDMSLHQAACAQIHHEPDDYVRQNKYNELALKKGSRVSENDFGDDETKFQRVNKMCSFCAVKLPSDKFAHHLNTCKERPYNCETCLKAMPYKEKEKHNQKCYLRVRGEKQHSNKFILQHEDADDGAQVMKKCPFCDDRLPDLIFNHHLDTCANELKKCDFCSDSVPAKDMDQHTRRCAYQSQKKYSEDGVDVYAQAAPVFSNKMKFTVCQYCGDRFTDMTFTQHVNFCSQPHKKCDYCFDSVAAKDMDEHIRKCRLANHQGNPYADDGRRLYTGDMLVPSKKYGKQKFLEENVEKCPSCNLKIPESRYHQHLRDCYAGKRPCKFCSVNIPYGYEHAHFQNCKEFPKAHGDKQFVSQSRKRYNVPSNDKKNESFLGKLTPGWLKNRGKQPDKCEAAPVQEVETVPLLPCEFCEELYPYYILIDHQSGCRPDLVSFPPEPADKASIRNTNEEVGRVHPKRKDDHGSNKSDWSVGSKNATAEEWKIVPSKKNKHSSRKPTSGEKMENSPEYVQPNAKSKYFYFQPNENAATATSSNSNGKKRYPQLSECPQSSKITESKVTCAESNPGKELPKKHNFTSIKLSAVPDTETNYTGSKVTCAESNPGKELPKKHNFTSFKFSTVPDTEENYSSDDSQKDHDLKRKFDDLSYAKNQHQLKNSNSYNFKVLYAMSDLASDNETISPIKSEITDADMCEEVKVVGGEQPRVLKAVGAERAEKRGIIRISKDSEIDYSVSNEHFENYSMNKQAIFGDNVRKENPPFDFHENIEHSKPNLTTPVVWNTNDNDDAKNEETFGSDYEKFFDDNHNMEAENISLSKTKKGFLECEDSKQEGFETSADGFNSSTMQENDAICVDSDLNAYFRYLAKDTSTLFGSVDKSQELTACATVNCNCGNEMCFCALTKQSSSSQAEISCKANALEGAASSSIIPDLLTNDSCPMDIEPSFKEISTSNQIEETALEKFVPERTENLVGDPTSWKKWRNKKSADTSDSE